MIEKSHIEEFVRQARRVGAAGLTTCSSGNLSWRIGDEALVSGTGSWLPELVEEKVSICKVATGEVQNGIKPSMESVFHLGIMREWYDVTEEDQKKMLDATVWCSADYGYFRGGGYSSRYLTRAEMPVTMIRLNLIKGLGPALQIAEGWTVNLPDEVSDKLWKRTDYTWPCTWFAPRVTGKGAFKTAYDVMNNWGANHGAISYGHIGADLITLCSIMRIPVSMHNVPEEDIFRPSAWNAFGMDKEGADYRACAAYGPMYK